MVDFLSAILDGFLELLNALGSSIFFSTFMIVCGITIGFAFLYSIISGLNS